MSEDMTPATPPEAEIVPAVSVEEASKILSELEKHVLKQFVEEYGALCNKHNVTLHPVFACDVDADGKDTVQRGLKPVWGGPTRAQN